MFQSLAEPDYAQSKTSSSRTTDATGQPSDGSSFKRGLRVGFPILLGYVPVGAAFGVLARQVGFSVAEAALCSAAVFAGAGQFISLSLLGGGANAIAVIIATGVVNLRHILFATTLSAKMPKGSSRLLAWLGFSLTDETFAVNIADLRSGHASLPSMAGVGLIAWVGWLSGTVIGASAAGWLGDPNRLGMQFAMPAMFAALFVALAEDRRHVLVGLVAAALVLAIPLLGDIIPPSSHAIVAAMLAATIAAVVSRDA